MSEPQKLNLEYADVKLGGKDVTTADNFEWDSSIKSANTVKRGVVVSRGKSKEITKFSLKLEQWEIGELESSLREEGKKQGNLIGITTSIDIVDEEGRSFKAKKLEIQKNKMKWDSKDADDYTTLEGEILDEYEADIHGGNK